MSDHDRLGAAVIIGAGVAVIVLQAGEANESAVARRLAFERQIAVETG